MGDGADSRVQVLGLGFSARCNQALHPYGVSELDQICLGKRK